MRCVSQFWLLTRKNLLLIWRNKVWTLMEIVVPLLIGIPILLKMGQKISTMAMEAFLRSQVRRGSLDPPGNGTKPEPTLPPGSILVEKLHYGIEILAFSLHPAKLDYRVWTAGKAGEWKFEQHWAAYNGLGGEPPNRMSTYVARQVLSIQARLDEVFIEIVKAKVNGTVADPGPPIYRSFHAQAPPMKLAVSFIGYIPGLLAILLFPGIIHLAKDISFEVEIGLREYMQVMGLSPLLFYLSHGFIGWFKSMILLPFFAYPLMGYFDLLPIYCIGGVIFLYSLSVSAFAILCSSILKTSSSVFKLAMILWLLTVIQPIVLPVERHDAMWCFIQSLNPNQAFSLALDLWLNYDERNKPIEWSDMIADWRKEFNFACICGMLLFDALWMFFGALMMDRLRSEQTNFFRDLLSRMSPMRPSSKKKKKNKGDDDNNNQLVDEEDEKREAAHADLEVKNVTKKFSLTGGWVLKGVNLKAIQGQITVLLGHNGAGKSTTFSILCGLASATSGKVKVNSKPVGLCPQKNPLFPKLTVAEHLWFFHHLKRGKDNHKTAGDALMRDLKFYDKRHELSMNLSGGTKRKLLVAMAIIGRSRVVLLDEPTAGMDPGARRAVEFVLQRIKKDRTVLLTTHYMDEAEKLGDWVTIMQGGRDVINGSPGYLKRKYGSGYILTVVGASLTADGQQDMVTPVTPEAVQGLGEAVQKAVAGALGGDAGGFPLGPPHGRQIEMTIPLSNKGNFPKMCKALEKLKEDGKNVSGNVVLVDFGLSLNTLEQVFLRVGELGEGKHEEQKVGHSEWAKARRRHGFCMVFAQFLAMLKKRLLYNLKNIPQFCVQILIPIGLFYCVSMIVNATDKDVNSSLVGPSMVHPARCVLEGNDASRFETERFRKLLSTGCELLELPGGANFNKEVYKAAHDSPRLAIGFWLNGKELLGWYNPNGYHTAPLMVNVADNVRLQQITNNNASQITTRYELYVPQTASQIEQDKGVKQARKLALIPLLLLALSILTSGCIVLLVEERTSNFQHQQLLTKLHPITFWGASLVYDLLLCMVVFTAGFFILHHGHVLSPHSLNLLGRFLALYLWACLPFIYCLSYMFASAAKANTLLIVWQVTNLVKWFGCNRHPAVDRITFSVEPGQCFGLLGTNGAGKTTTIDILTGLKTSSGGRIRVYGKSGAGSSAVGYCPQFDAVLMDFTGRQILNIMATCHGYASPAKVAKQVLAAVGMSHDGDKAIKFCSGGQKRKISVGVALLAQDAIRILDEPTAGVDPKARRDIWQHLDLSRQPPGRTAQLLTSHSMDECEALCTKISIMIKGRMFAIGSSQHLKSKYSGGYTMTVELKPDDSEEQDPEQRQAKLKERVGAVTDAIIGAFPEAKIKEAGHSRVCIYVVPSGELPWSSAWASMNKLGADPKLTIADYSVTQCGLEDTFMKVTAQAN
ncbi:unnamed protein product, partial [Mesorhabditis spiculigera]